jgi:hypothetical protein
LSKLATKKANIVMNYNNYPRVIVRAWGWGLIGWPSDVPFKRMSKQSTISHVRAVYNALKAGTCKWVKLSTKEKQDEHIKDFEENAVQGEIVEKVHKMRTDKGGSHVVQKRKLRTSKKGRSGADLEEEDGETSGMEDEAVSSKSKPPKSAQSSQSPANISIDEKQKAIQKLSALQSKCTKTTTPAKSKQKSSRDDDEEVDKPPRR